MNRKEFYNTLSEDVKAKIKACKTEEEMMNVLAEEKIELDAELLESVNGGYTDQCACFGKYNPCSNRCYRDYC